ncbi:hypothetical protein ACFXNY_24070, partial [Streptomyces sindenensis]|uniref:hypothetical protein n=1 Tax=Streptomyces sindenensis TaxID=67363 RepID=UPI0036D1E71E
MAEKTAEWSAGAEGVSLAAPPHPRTAALPHPRTPASFAGRPGWSANDVRGGVRQPLRPGPGVREPTLGP